MGYLRLLCEDVPSLPGSPHYSPLWRTLLGGRWESTLVESTGQRHAAPQMPCRAARRPPGGRGCWQASWGISIPADGTTWPPWPYNATLPHPLMPATHAGRTFKERAQVATVRPPVALQSQDEAMWWERRWHSSQGGFAATSLLQPSAAAPSGREHGAASLTVPATVLLLQPLDLAASLNSISTWVFSNKMG